MLGLPYIGSPESVHVFTKVSALIWFTVCVYKYTNDYIQSMLTPTVYKYSTSIAK